MEHKISKEPEIHQKPLSLDVKMEQRESGAKDVPKQTRGLNWGAFWLRWIWGIRHRCWSSFLTLIPVAGNLAAFYLLFKGNEIAWNNCKWKNADQFRKTQRWWSRLGWGIAAVLAFPAFLVLRSYYL